MPRYARKKSNSGIYHIMSRGINRQDIFGDEEDKAKFLQTLIDVKEISEYKMYAYCLMGNHVHLLIKEEKEPIDLIMKRIGARYVYWYNWKYERCGHLFQDRFKSESVEDDAYFLAVLRYILRNPLEAGIEKEVKNYKWSSYNEYMDIEKITDIKYALDLISLNKEKQIQKFSDYINERNDDQCLEMNEQIIKIKDEEVKRLVWENYEIEAAVIQNLPKDKQTEIIIYLKKQDGISLRQIARIAGLTVNRIYRA